MSTFTPHPPIPRQPLGATFITAISILGAVAVIQLFAVIVHYVPEFKAQVADSVAREHETEQAPTPAQAAPQNTAATTPAVPAGDLQRAKKLFEEASQAYRIGDFDAAMKKLEDTEAILPGDPAVLQLKALVYERQGQLDLAVQTLQEALQYPGLAAEYRDGILKKIAQLKLAINAGLGGNSNPPSSRANEGRDSRQDTDAIAMRDQVGLRAGADLGIVDIRMKEDKPDTKNFQVSVKSRPGKPINVQDVKILAYIYEETMDGEVDLTKSKIISEWLSPPVNWSDNEPELLNLQYLLSPDDKAEGRKYHGYVVGVYYNGELQDFRAEPGDLNNKFPLPLTMPPQ